MRPRAIALLSGGLDSMLAIRLVQQQGVEVEALNFRTAFTCCQNQAAEAARELDVSLTVLEEREEYLDVIRHPRHGYGRGANPCLDCRIYMFRLAGEWMRERGAQMVISGEVAGQRPMSQKKRDLALISKRSGLEDRLLRPLSARLLPLTTPEREGLVDREKLCAFSGRGRKGLIALAHEMGFRRIPHPSAGCALTSPEFAAGVLEVVKLDPAAEAWDFELLKIGRHIRPASAIKVVLGRDQSENDRLLEMFGRRPRTDIALVRPTNFAGPTALVLGAAVTGAIDHTRELILRYSKTPGDDPRLEVEGIGPEQKQLRCATVH